MAFRTQIHKKKFGKKCFRTLQGTMSHRPLTNTSSLKIAAAYRTVSFLGLHKSEPEIYIGLSPALHFQCVASNMKYPTLLQKNNFAWP
jgi:hypothetical protein